MKVREANVILMPEVTFTRGSLIIVCKQREAKALLSHTRHLEVSPFPF